MNSTNFESNNKIIPEDSSNIIEGKIVKGIGGFYYVETPFGEVTTRGRGNLKRDGETLYVGDKVLISILDESSNKILYKPSDNEEKNLNGVIEEVLPRYNSFIRPPVANVDLMVLVVSAKKPKVNLTLLDKFLCVCESKDVDCVICVNKTEDESSISEYNKIATIYKGVYETYPVSAQNSSGIEKLRDRFQGLTIALAGPSGVGKSTILNALTGRGHMQVGEISHKTSRGKHTTRHVELVPIDDDGDSLIFDTPGFTSLELPNIDKFDLRHLFPEIERTGRRCKFQDCLHIGEPGCAVLESLEKNEISKSRYDSYRIFLDGISNKKKY